MAPYHIAGVFYVHDKTDDPPGVQCHTLADLRRRSPLARLCVAFFFILLQALCLMGPSLARVRAKLHSLRLFSSI